MVFVLFLLAVSAYVAFLVWCFLPIFRPFGRRWVRWLRVAAGVMLLAGNLSTVFALPLILPINYISEALANELLAVVLFTRTTPIYARNVIDRLHTTARVVDIRYPMEIAGVRYAPVVRTACTTRRMLGLDKGNPVYFANFPTSVGGELVARAGADVVAFLDPTCPDPKTGQIDSKRPRLWNVFIVRGEGEKSQLFHVLGSDAGTVVVDDIVLRPSELVSIKAAPAAEVVPVAALWPMRTSRQNYVPEIFERYMRLRAGVSGCVEDVLQRIVELPGQPAERRSRPRKVPNESRSNDAAYCRDAFARYIRQSEIPRLQPQ